MASKLKKLLRKTQAKVRAGTKKLGKSAKAAARTIGRNVKQYGPTVLKYAAAAGLGGGIGALALGALSRAKRVRQMAEPAADEEAPPQQVFEDPIMPARPQDSAIAEAEDPMDEIGGRFEMLRRRVPRWGRRFMPWQDDGHQF